MTPEERARHTTVGTGKQQERCGVCGMVWPCLTVELWDKLDAATKDAERWRAQAGWLAAALELIRGAGVTGVSGWTISSLAKAALADHDAQRALAELRALREVAAAASAYRQSEGDDYLARRKNESLVHSVTRQRELELDEALDALAVTQAGVRDG